MISAAMKPPAPTPTGKPRYMIAVMVVRMRVGAYSAVSAIEIGISAPMPRPVRNRTAMKGVIAPTSNVASSKEPKVATAPSATRLRPKRSASGPAARVPNSTPRRVERKTGPNPAGLTCHCGAITGTTKAVVPISKPSMMTRKPHHSATRNWNLPKPRLSISSVTLTLRPDIVPPAAYELLF
jgi:hypothetical protein